MDKIGEIKRIWRERFNKSKVWMNEVFTRIYNDDEALAMPPGNDTESVASTLLLRRYAMKYCGEVISAGYIHGAATTREMQRHGYMSRLMEIALRESRRRGDAVVALQPAHRRQYGFFDRFGFVTTFYINELRYTSKHQFPHDSSRYIIETSGHDPAEFAAAYIALTSNRLANVMHSADDFKTILIDIELGGGATFAARSLETGSLSAIAIAANEFDTIAIRELAASDDDARNAVLDAVKLHWGEKMVAVEAPAIPASRIRPESRGMSRIVNVEAMLGSIAKISPGLRQTIRVSDPLLNENTGVYAISDGRVSKHPFDYADCNLNLDVTVSILTSILFSTPHTGEIFSLPAARPFMSLMLR